ncbi:hypothetical protein G4B88_021013 [Cannabis sativa]|uniref:DUF4283 domain-containing protein n=1 Tax=Cannabis sativa TaxID=3483 RepID=A0A7J6GCE8_CANSA|nr:hypothetical protein G4B88_021013 [Cannabis sativa]
MDPADICEVFEDAVQINQDDITFSLNPGEVDEPQEENKVLLGKIISRYKLGKGAIQGSPKLSWNAIRGWKWKEIEDGLLQFTFANRNDAMNVLARRPWFVCGALLVIMPWPAWLTPTEVRFDKTPIWVNVESIPPFYWNLSNLKELATKASPVFDLPHGIEDVVGMSTLRFRATIDLNKPIFPGFFLKRQKLKDLWLQYKYEKLPKLCFKCGLFTHDQSVCFKAPTVIKDGNGNFFPMFGIWLKKDAQEKIVTDVDAENGDKEDEEVITQLSLVCLPGIGEVAPLGNNSKAVLIKDLIEAAAEYSARKAPKGAEMRKGNRGPNHFKEASGTTESTEKEKGKQKETKSICPPSEINQTETSLHTHFVDSVCDKDAMKDRSNEDPEGGLSIPYRASPLGSQAQVVKWPSLDCWAIPKARELYMGALTNSESKNISKAQEREKPLMGLYYVQIMNPHLLIQNRRKMEGAHLMSKITRCKGDQCEKEKDVLTMPIEPESFSTGSTPDERTNKRRGRPRKQGTPELEGNATPKRIGRPPKDHKGLSTTPKSGPWSLLDVRGSLQDIQCY